MRWYRMVISMLGATVLVLGLLAVSLHYYDRPREAGADGVRGFEIDYLTPEEAAALLGEEPERYRPPERVSLPLVTPADDEPAP